MWFVVRAALIVAVVVLVTPGARAATDGWRHDAPGTVHHVSAGDLPKPFVTPSAFNGPRVVHRPPGAALKVPPGFTVKLFADKLNGPRLLRVAPNGDIFVAESGAGRILVLRPNGDGDRPAQRMVFAAKLNQPFGIAFYPPGPDPRFVYIGDSDAILRFPYRNGDLTARGKPQVLIHGLWSSGGHSTRDVTFSPDGKHLFVSVGSGSNDAEGLPRKSPKAIAAFEAKHALGAAWGEEQYRADVLEFDPMGGHLQIYATGIRNCVTMPIEPADGSLWCTVNERDGLGDNLPPDYVTRVHRGAFYGWPWFYIGDHPDPRHPKARPDLVGRVTVPDVLIQAHSAPLQAVFYNGTMFPEFRGSLFVALHGSWNRAHRTGGKVVRVIFKNGQPTGDYEDFLTGFVVSNRDVWGRPVGVGVDRAGALLISDDGNGTIWRVTRP